MLLWGLGDRCNVMGSRKVETLSGVMVASTTDLARDIRSFHPEDGPKVYDGYNL
jgi:hypothetical protein